jgi:hypothetical protein
LNFLRIWAAAALRAARFAGSISGKKHKISHRTFPLALQFAVQLLKITHTVLFYPKLRICARGFCGKAGKTRQRARQKKSGASHVLCAGGKPANM